ncbi:MAG: hypothetical protein N2749_05240 [Clostridia bacterium]|nr:hypothetical protein [Clostridia bacterium]
MTDLSEYTFEGLIKEIKRNEFLDLITNVRFSVIEIEGDVLKLNLKDCKSIVVASEFIMSLYREIPKVEVYIKGNLNPVEINKIYFTFNNVEVETEKGVTYQDMLERFKLDNINKKITI